MVRAPGTGKSCERRVGARGTRGGDEGRGWGIQLQRVVTSAGISSYILHKYSEVVVLGIYLFYGVEQVDSVLTT